MTKWEKAQEWEKQWWQDATNNCTNTTDEERKQYVYAQHMGLLVDDWGRIDLQGKSVLDIGGGPCSLLLKTINRGYCRVHDPMEYPAWVEERYVASGICYEQMRAEDSNMYGWAEAADEVWVYNVLEHVDDLDAVMDLLTSDRIKCLRIFEWVDNKEDEGHLHVIRKEWLESKLGPGQNVEVTFPNGVVCHGWAKVRVPSSCVPRAEPSIPRVTSSKSPMRFHIPAIPHTVTSNRFNSCAYTQKVRKLCRMLTNLGHEVYHYGCEGSEVVCTEDVPVVSDAYRQQFYPDEGIQERQFSFHTDDEYHRTFHQRTAEAIRQRMGERDLLLCPWGWGHKPIVEHLSPFIRKTIIPVESGIGYEDTFADFRVFESYAWMHYIYGKEKTVNGNWYDAVIPNYFDPDEFTFNPDKEDFFLYLGRLVNRKGIDVAVQMTERIGAKLVIAGQGTLKSEQDGLDIKGDHVEFVGYADVEKRRDLLSRAKCLLAPTYYIEPFCGVSIEAQLSGTPVICTDWGVFNENVLHGITGYRCRTLEQFVWAGRNIGHIDNYACHEWASQNYSMQRVALMYQEYFNMLYGLWGEGWPQPNDERTELDWLAKKYPP